MQYTLKNARLEATFESFGAELISIRDAAGKDYLWYGDSAFWGRRSPVLFTFVGKVKDGKYRCKDVEYTMGQYPFAFRLEIGYKLVDNTLRVLWKVINPDKEEPTFLKIIR